MTSINPTQYVQVSANQIPLDHINLEYLSGVNVSEEAQCLLDISNNQNAIQTTAAVQQHAHSQPHQHQSLAAQHIQQFKIEYPNDGDFAEEEEVVSQGPVEVETVHTIEENSSINSYDAHNAAAIAAGVAPSAATHHHSAPTSVDSKTLYAHQYNGTIAMVTSVVTAATNTTATSQAHPQKRARHHEILKNGEQDFTDVISAAVDYFKMQTAVADADAAFAKYILEEVRQMSKKRKNEFKRKVTTWLTSEDETAGLE